MAKLPIGRLTESVTFLSSSPPAIAVTSLMSIGAVASAVTGTPHGLTSGDYVSIRGAVPLAYNTLSTQVTVTSPTQFSYDLPNPIGQSYPTVILASGPTHYWRLNDTAGTIAVDQVGAAPGTLSGGVTHNQPSAIVADGTGAMTFDGTGDIITGVTVPLVPPFTLEAWIRTSAAAPMVATSLGSDVCYLGAQSGQARATNGQANIYSGAARIDDQAWHHLAALFTAASLSLYVDGALVATAASVAYAGSTTRPFEIGHAAAYGQFWIGSLDEVAIYPRTLSALDILAHYQAASSTTVATGTITVTFQSDSQGGQPDDWYDAGQAFAYIEPLNAAERLAVSAVAATVNYRAVVHYRTNLTPQMKLMWLRYQESDPRELAIFGVYPHPEPAYAHRFLVLECGELA